MALIGLIDLDEPLDARADAALHRALREGGVTRVIAPAEAAMLDCGDRVILVGATTLLDGALVSAMGDGSAATLACLPNEPDNAGYELIDGATRWAGWAALPGDMVAETAQELAPEWSLASTLVRRAVQQGALRIDAARAGALIALDRPDAVAAVDEARLRAAMQPRTGIAGQTLERIALFAARHLLGVEHGLRWTGVAGFVALTVFGAALAYGWLAPAAVALLLVTVAARIARGLALVAAKPLSWSDRATDAVALTGLAAATGWMWTWSGQWGVFPLAIVLAADTVMAAEDETALGEPLWWRADTPALTVMILIAALAGQPIAGLVIGTIHAAASFAVTRRRLRVQRDAIAT